MGFYRYFNYFIKCVIRRIVNSDWFWKISFLVLMVFVTGFLCNNIVYGATTTINKGMLGRSYVYPVFVGGSTNLDNVWMYKNLASSQNTGLNDSAFYFWGEMGVTYTILVNITDSSVTRTLTISTSSEVPSTGVTCSPPSNFNMVGSFNYTYTIIGTDSYINVTYHSASYSNSQIRVRYTSDDTTIVESVNTQTEEITGSISSSTTEITNTLSQETEKIEDTMTNTEYDDAVVDIDVSSAEDVDDTEVTGLFTTVFENLSNLISSSSWSTVEVIEIGLPYTDGKIQLRSDILSNIVGNSLLRTLINVAWYSLFGLYVFRFVTNIYHSIKSGNILNGINFDNEVISSTML